MTDINVWCLCGMNASGKNTTAEYMLATGIADQIVSFREFVATVLDTLKLPSVWHAENFKFYNSVYRALLGVSPQIWIRLLEKEVKNTGARKYIVLDCCDTLSVAWTLTKPWALIVLSPENYIRHQWFNQKYKQTPSPDIDSLIWNIDVNTIGREIVRRRQKRSALVKFRHTDPDHNMNKIQQAIESIEKGEEPQIW